MRRAGTFSAVHVGLALRMASDDVRMSADHIVTQESK